MAITSIYKYAWLVETLRRGGRLTFEEINRRWLDASDLSDGVGLSKRTFHKWRIAAEELFGIVIDCERKGGYHFFIAAEDEVKGDDLRLWLMNTLTTANILGGNQRLKDRICLEHVPSGQLYLEPILSAMARNVAIKVEYQGYWRDESEVFEVEPYCVKLFKQRWYLVGRSPLLDDIRVYALDRIYDLRIVDEHSFELPKDFNAGRYFADSYGVIVDEDYDVETVRLRVSPQQAKYIRSLPLHASQVETEPNVFELRLRPTFDFQQEILSHIPDIEVLEPQWLRDEIQSKLRQSCFRQ